MQLPNTVINLVDQVSAVNFGIWHAAIATSEALAKNYGVVSWLVAPKGDFEFPRKDFPHVHFQEIERLKTGGAADFFKRFDPRCTVVASHGCWQYPTRWGAVAKSLGFRWIYTPHGMLEPWSMQQKQLKKWVYFRFIERRLARKADLVRAVGKPEMANLEKEFQHTMLIPNAVYERDLLPKSGPPGVVQVLFLARLHAKKGVIPLIKAWQQSVLWRSPAFRLVIAGTDDGEQAQVENLLQARPDGNIVFVGPQFGENKTNLLKTSSFYILPSISEGFPTSVLEAMAAGLVPIITKGCNFPEALEAGVAIETTQDVAALTKTLNQLAELSPETTERLSRQNRDFVQANYLWSSIARKQKEIYFGEKGRG